MLEEKGVVVETNDEFAWVETQRQQACGHCASKSSCGTASLASVLGQKTTVVKAVNSIHANIGDNVIVAIGEQVLLRSALLMYLVPLLLMFAFAGGYEMLTQQNWLAHHEGWTIVSGALGFGLGLLWLNYLNHNLAHRRQYQPIVIRFE